YVKQMLESDALLAGLFIEGEISNFSAHSSGHMYFTLKDPAAALSSVMFAGYAGSLAFAPKNGQKVIAYGRLSIYEKTGQYQFYVELMEPAGIGGLQLAFAQLVEKLQAEGLFEEARKRAIPAYPACVAVITSPTGAAVQDIIRVVKERNPAIRLVIAPALVQGQGAGEDIARAMAEVNAWGDADVIILGRGGGSAEDLWAFNEEITARAVAVSKIPVISAVGHETDITISDLVADRRAPTPTAAAQMVAYDYAQVVAFVHAQYTALNTAVKDDIINRHAQAKALLAQLTRQAGYRLSLERQNLTHSTALLEKVSPYAAFKRGYALVQDEAGQVVTSASIDMGTRLTLHFEDGRVTAEVVGAVKD
ncbi:MAG: exodeoxyribonuclease VII large subunit, partial [Defluviitaleaceae bacterium]|nr:exodeoxyribonuclease VII large subunit [Defluviitaleaceae bacterium]